MPAVHLAITSKDIVARFGVVEAIKAEVNYTYTVCQLCNFQKEITVLF